MITATNLLEQWGGAVTATHREGSAVTATHREGDAVTVAMLLTGKAVLSLLLCYSQGRRCCHCCYATHREGGAITAAMLLTGKVVLSLLQCSGCGHCRHHCNKQLQVPVVGLAHKLGRHSRHWTSKMRTRFIIIRNYEVMLNSDSN